MTTKYIGSCKRKKEEEWNNEKPDEIQIKYAV